MLSLIIMSSDIWVRKVTGWSAEAVCIQGISTFLSDFPVVTGQLIHGENLPECEAVMFAILSGDPSQPPLV
jgi:hypothetical protein